MHLDNDDLSLIQVVLVEHCGRMGDRPIDTWVKTRMSDVINRIDRHLKDEAEEKADG